MNYNEFFEKVKIPGVPAEAFRADFIISKKSRADMLQLMFLFSKYKVFTYDEISALNYAFECSQLIRVGAVKLGNEPETLVSSQYFSTICFYMLLATEMVTE